MSNPFWLSTPMAEMSSEQWESLCDGCAKCCRMQLVDEEEGVLMQTDVVCDYLNLEDLGCSDYANRTTNVPTCIQVTPNNISELYWLPESCAYRRVEKGLDLPDWHHLKTHNREKMFDLGHSVKNVVIHEREIEGELEDRIITWIPIDD